MQYKLRIPGKKTDLIFEHADEYRALVDKIGFSNVQLWVLNDEIWDELTTKGIQAMFVGGL